MSYLVRSQARPEAFSFLSRETLVWSGDRRFFFFIQHRGSLTADENIYTFKIYEASRLREWMAASGDAHAPVACEFDYASDTPAGAAIRGSRWDAASEAVLFLGVVKDGTTQGFRLDVGRCRSEQLTASPNGVGAFQASGSGVAFYTDEHVAPAPMQYPFEPYVRDEAGRVLPLKARGKTKSAVFAKFGADAARRIDIDLAPQISMSPDGTRLVGIDSSDRTFVILDVASGREIRTQKFAAGGPAPGIALWTALWPEGSARVVLVNAVPYDKGAPRAARPEPGSLIDLRIDENTFSVIAPMRESGESAAHSVSRVAWISATRDLRLTRTSGDGKTSEVGYVREGKAWVSRNAYRDNRASVGGAGDLEIRIQEGPNQPPRVVASSKGKRKTIAEVNPELRQLAIAPVEEFGWTDPDGSQRVGLLRLPPSRTGPVPVVIQFNPVVQNDEGLRPFFPDGSVMVGSPVQSLAARGIGVLEVRTGDLPALESRAVSEGPAVVARLDAAVAALSRKGIANPAKIGLNGWSRGGYQTYFVVTHPGEVRLSAAVAADAFTGAYGDYLLAMGTGSFHPGNFEAGPRGSFWERKSEWLQYETTFNVDRATAPILFTENQAEGGWTDYSPNALATLGAFRLNKKPVEYLLFPTGRHQLIRPREQLAMLDVVTDWFTFWLLGQEDPSSEKAALYARWHQLKK